MRGEVLVHEVEKFSADVGVYVSAKWGVEPKDVTRSFLCSVDAGWGSSGKHSILDWKPLNSVRCCKLGRCIRRSLGRKKVLKFFC